MNSPDFSVVVPLFNEADSVAILQKDIFAALEGRNYELILVDDGSTDGTILRIERGPNVRALQLRRNSGQSAAMLVGCALPRASQLCFLTAICKTIRGTFPSSLPRSSEALTSSAAIVCFEGTRG